MTSGGSVTPPWVGAVVGLVGANVAEVAAEPVVSVESAVPTVVPVAVVVVVSAAESVVVVFPVASVTMVSVTGGLSSGRVSHQVPTPAIITAAAATANKEENVQ